MSESIVGSRDVAAQRSSMAFKQSERSTDTIRTNSGARFAFRPIELGSWGDIQFSGQFRRNGDLVLTRDRCDHGLSFIQGNRNLSRRHGYPYESPKAARLGSLWARVSFDRDSVRTAVRNGGVEVQVEPVVYLQPRALDS